MQTDVKPVFIPDVFTPEMLVDIFPFLKVVGKPKDKPNEYAIHVDVMNGQDIVKLAQIVRLCAVDLFISRYGKGMTIKINMHPDGYIADKQPLIAPFGNAECQKIYTLDLERKRQILEVGFAFDKLTISEVVDLCLNLDSEDTIAVLEDIEREFPNEL